MLKTGIKFDGYCSKTDVYGYEEALKKIKAHGYDCIDYGELADFQSPLFAFSDEQWDEYLQNFRAAVQRNGLEISQMHGLWPTVGNDASPEDRAKSIEFFKREIDAAAKLGCKYLVVHPCMAYGWAGGTEQEMFDVNVDMLTKLFPDAEKNKVTLCLENMPFQKGRAFSTARELKNVITAMNSPYVKACLDIGHLSAMQESAYDAIVALGKDLAVLHIHDDVFGQDRHLFPFQGRTDWQGFIRGLKEIDFQGCLSLETCVSLAMPEPAREEMRLALAKLIKWFAEQIEK